MNVLFESLCGFAFGFAFGVWSALRAYRFQEQLDEMSDEERAEALMHFSEGYVYHPLIVFQLSPGDFDGYES